MTLTELINIKVYKTDDLTLNPYLANSHKNRFNGKNKEKSFSKKIFEVCKEFEGEFSILDIFKKYNNDVKESSIEAAIRTLLRKNLIRSKRVTGRRTVYYL